VNRSDLPVPVTAVCDPAAVALEFTYSNVSHRPPARFLTALAHIHHGVRDIQEQVGPYAVWWRDSNLRALTSGLPLWVAMGDSLTQGIGATRPDRGWVGQLSGRLTGRGWDHAVVNLSVNGARVEDAIQRQLPVLRALHSSGHDVALVTVIIGSNDVVVPRYRRHLVSRFAQLLDRLPPGSVVSNLPNGRLEARTADHLLRDRARAGRVVRADSRGEAPPTMRGLLASDGFHPNDRGYAVIADAFDAAVARAGRPGWV
jgi:lysophospholipase L1-like esterase